MYEGGGRDGEAKDLFDGEGRYRNHSYNSLGVSDSASHIFTTTVVASSTSKSARKRIASPKAAESTPSQQSLSLSRLVFRTVCAFHPCMHIQTLSHATLSLPHYIPPVSHAIDCLLCDLITFNHIINYHVLRYTKISKKFLRS